LENMGDALTSVNPATGALIATYQPFSAAEIEERVAGATTAYLHWRAVPLDRRTALLSRAADLLDQRRETYARLITEEMGKVLEDARQEVAKCATACRYYAANAAAMLAPEVVQTGAVSSYVVFDPLGPILAVMPWNFPFWQLFRFAAPSLVAGN